MGLKRRWRIASFVGAEVMGGKGVRNALVLIDRSGENAFRNKEN